MEINLKKLYPTKFFIYEQHYDSKLIEHDVRLKISRYVAVEATDYHQASEYMTFKLGVKFDNERWFPHTSNYDGVTKSEVKQLITDVENESTVSFITHTVFTHKLEITLESETNNVLFKHVA